METTSLLLGQIRIYNFSLILAVGALIGLHGVVHTAEIEGHEPRTYLNQALGILVGSLIGARLIYVAVHGAYFKEHLTEIPQLWLGGLSWTGALAGGLITTAIIALIRGWDSRSFFDTNTSLLVAMTISIWLGCWAAGTAYGPKTDLWWGVPAGDIQGQINLRWPVQLVGALLTTLLSWITSVLWKPLRSPGLKFGFTLSGISLIQITLVALRVDPAPRWGNARLDFWAALGFFILAALTTLIIYLKTYRAAAELESL
ncbi:MAG: prolipoprotein diacylglyceryl transferase family protein [Chloroflexota bacterium]